MHAPSAYERYLLRERARYGWENSEDNEYPAWLVLEQETYDWIFRLSRRILDPWHNATVSKQMLNRVETIPTIRFLRYRDISPVLKNTIADIAAEFALLNEDLKSPEMWMRPFLLSKDGIDRWGKTAEIVCEKLHVLPDPEWRENWERKNLAPYCTRKEAEEIATDLLRKSRGIDLREKDPENGRSIYYCFRSAKEGIYKLRFGKWGRFDDPYNDIGAVIVDMLTKEGIIQEI